MRIATIDVGTNTAKLFVGEAPGGTLAPCYEERRYVRLGEGLDRSGEITPAALERLTAALLAFRDAAHQHGAGAIFVGATSASRDARNRDAVMAHVREKTGLDYHILTGEEEAALSFRGAVSALPALDGPCTVVDIGGGSTELVGGTPGHGGFDYRASVDVGSVRVTERCFTRQPPPRDEVVGAEKLVRDALAATNIPADAARPLVGAAGTTGALARMHLGFVRWADVAGRPATLSRLDVARWKLRLMPLTFDETLALNPRVMAGRADIFLAGLVVLEQVMAFLDAGTLHISPRGLRHGLALQKLVGD